MTKWITETQAAELIGCDVNYFRKLVKQSDNPPPFVRPSTRSKLFDPKALLLWQQEWTVSNRQAG